MHVPSIFPVQSIAFKQKSVLTERIPNELCKERIFFLFSRILVQLRCIYTIRASKVPERIGEEFAQVHFDSFLNV